VAGRRLGEASHRLGIPAVVLSFALSILAFVDVSTNGPQSISLYRLLESGALVVDLGFYIDQVTVLLLLLVTGVSAIVHVYSSRYMIGDPRYNRFFAVIGAFTSAMCMLVMSRNLLMMYVCWELMGICSYLLIAHWAQRKAAGRAATKAFLVNAIADVGLGFGVILTFNTFGTLDIPLILERAASVDGQVINLLGWIGLQASVEITTLITLLLFTGAMGKSAQVPFHVWLPFAMEAPTPVSALIHAATMVNAGPFLLVRFSPLLMLSPVAMTVIAVVGGTTALYAAVVSLTQTDIKKILAYSTISQIGFMIMTCGLGAFVVAIFHLLAHGFYKAFLFLSTGNALQAVASAQTHKDEPAHGHQASVEGTAFVGSFVLSCLPAAILFSGPYESMWAVHQTPAARLGFWIVALATIFFTAMYLFRGISSIFHREVIVSGSLARLRFFTARHLLIVMVIACFLFSFLSIFWQSFAEFLAPALGRSVPPTPAPSTGLIWPLIAAFAGCSFAWLLHRRPVAFADSAFGRRLYVLFANKLYFDEFYDRYFVMANRHLAVRLSEYVESRVIDRLVNAPAAVSVAVASWLLRFLEGRTINRLVDGSASASVLMARWIWRVLEGRGIQANVDRLARQADAVGRLFQHAEVHTLQQHLLLVIGGLLAILALFYLLVLGG
jgi:NADH-quinone oxidoreductase subunit L